MITSDPSPRAKPPPPHIPTTNTSEASPRAKPTPPHIPMTSSRGRLPRRPSPPPIDDSHQRAVPARSKPATSELAARGAGALQGLGRVVVTTSPPTSDPRLAAAPRADARDRVGSGFPYPKPPPTPR